jgi:hypothetical protein
VAKPHKSDGIEILSTYTDENVRFPFIVGADER